MDLVGTEKESLWKEVLVSKYGEWRNLRNTRVNREESLWWRDIKIITSKEEWGICFEHRI